MPDEAIIDLLRKASFSFIGTIEYVGAATTNNIPMDERTAVVRVDFALHWPSGFGAGFIPGNRITLQFSADQEVPKVGETAAFFADGIAFGESIALAEVGRLSVDAVESHVSAAIAAGQPKPFAALECELETQQIREHAESADAVVLARVMKLEQAFEPVPSGHNPDWWKATFDIYHVEKGEGYTRRAFSAISK